LAGFFVFAQTDLRLRSRKCGNFGPWSLVAKFPFLAAIVTVSVDIAEASHCWDCMSPKVALLQINVAAALSNKVLV
jgi:hypothetical protein